MYDFIRDPDRGVDGGIDGRRQTIQKVGSEVFLHSFFAQNVNRLIVCNGGFVFRVIDADLVIAVDMDHCLVLIRIAIGNAMNPVVAVYDLQIDAAVIIGILIQVEVVPAGDCVRFQTIPGNQTDLTAVIRHTQVTIAHENLVGGIVEEIIDIEFQADVLCKIIFKKMPAQINRIGNVQIVIPEIHKADLFFKEEVREPLRCVQKLFRRNRWILQNPVGGKIGLVSLLLRSIAAEADVFHSIGNIGTEIDVPILFLGSIHAGQKIHGLPRNTVFTHKYIRFCGGKQLRYGRSCAIIHRK